MQQPQTFRETEGMKLKCVFIEPNELSVAYDRLVSVCTDIVFVDKEGRWLLPYRIIHSSYGWWWKGGSMRKGETIEQSLTRLMKREIGFMPEQGVEPLVTFFHFWGMRNEAPQENGKHDEIHLHFVEVDDATISRIEQGLNPDEYDVSKGLMLYDGTQEVRPVIAAMYRRYRLTQMPEVQEALRVANETLVQFGLSVTPHGLTSL